MDRAQLPPVVYAPVLTGVAGESRLRMHRLADGRVALYIYSALDRLFDHYAADAPWALLTLADLQLARDEAPFDLLLLDHDLMPHAAAS